MIPCEPKGEEAAAAFPIMEDYNMTFTAYAWIFEEFYKVRYNGGMIEKFCVFFFFRKMCCKSYCFYTILPERHPISYVSFHKFIKGL